MAVKGIWKVYKEGRVVFEGSTAEMKKALPELGDCHFLYDGVRHHGYFFVKIGELNCDRSEEYKSFRAESKKNIIKAKPLPKEVEFNKMHKKDYYEYVKYHLKTYGNTVVSRHLDYVLKQLKKDGIKVNCRDGIYPEYGKYSILSI